MYSPGALIPMMLTSYPGKSVVWVAASGLECGVYDQGHQVAVGGWSAPILKLRLWGQTSRIGSCSEKPLGAINISMAAPPAVGKENAPKIYQMAS